MKTLVKIVLPIVVLVGGIVGAWVLTLARPEVVREERAPVLPLVRVLTVEKRDIVQVVRAHGTVEPRTQTALVAQVGGAIVRTSQAFAVGGEFSPGEVLVEIDRQDHELAITRAQAQVSQAELRLSLEEAEAEVARVEWERIGEGAPDPFVLREPHVAEARAALAAARAALAQAQLELARTRVRAPYRGLVRETLVDLGQVVAPGTPLARVYATDIVEVRLPVALGDLAFLDLAETWNLGGPLHPGLEVRLEADLAGTRRAWRGRVVRTSGEVDARTRMVDLVAQVKNPESRSGGGGALPVGLFVDAEIAGRTLAGIVELPRAALRAQDQVMIVDGDDRLRFRTVSVVRRTRETVLIERGLAAGERVLVSPLEVVTDGMWVRSVEDGEEPSTPGARVGGTG